MIEFVLNIIGGLIGLGMTLVVLTFVGAILLMVFSGVGIAILGVPFFLLLLLVLGIFLPLLLPVLIIGAVIWMVGSLFCWC
ncbi:hypothetical protein N8766_02845 [bacterium]|jgi:hypothetical protein|nr:hypothetical protein [Verrucomicrobiota bacterium]MDA7510260.1 hypothetical protein [Verrucomicrobiota bacterium]MDA7633024.1 hypothetical protein [bacterium]MDB4745642.1 hypothetical protein [Verrucomicrobiota bacterium]